MEGSRVGLKQVPSAEYPKLEEEILKRKYEQM
jgi:hypothetical protein